MFEDFSFSSASSAHPPTLESDDRVMVDSDSGLISPLSSRCPSPKVSAYRLPRNLSRSRSLFLRSPLPPPTSVPYPYEDRRISIGILTKKLHEHSLTTTTDELSDDASAAASPTTPHSISDVPALEPSARFPGYLLTPPQTGQDDESYYEDSSSSPVTSSPSVASLDSPFLCPNSSPIDFISLDSSMEPITCCTDQRSIRLQRQVISRLQCHAPAGIDSVRKAYMSSSDEPSGADIPPLAFPDEDCHPSSLPPQISPRRRAVTLRASRFRPTGGSNIGGLGDGAALEPQLRRKSSSHALISHRIDKNYGYLSGRELRKKSEQELRRKSIVSAALASME
ncbi:hypothetical protein ASPZODRAFT_1400683 [Penicilliopsis zonata CBS 506.65]|uniref:Uncharacterized protein n=1 Tax=Penicilliopsis zonata CBS 506.65 TaxID=1073090 RepID=A0A1L9SPS0_9EURO|nr:hypothetical protein ASPZODRAFT_1400683 [Penicilliopsis zonata CBS 506.65]OJJ49116.1 hypothetical protein ASPZODRAFT_1400683 [Penicilliopsis zonata CBS 506.65]